MASIIIIILIILVISVPVEGRRRRIDLRKGCERKKQIRWMNIVPSHARSVGKGLDSAVP